MEGIRKSKKKDVKVDENERMRRWEEMNHDILMNILGRLLPWFDWWLSAANVCKPWLSAALDVLFPPHSQVLDLRPYDVYLGTHLRPIDAFLRHRLYYMLYLDLVLRTRPLTTYTQIFLPKSYLPLVSHHLELAIKVPYSLLSERLPSLEKVVIPTPCDPLNVSCISKSLCNWRKLEEARVPANMVIPLGRHCENIRSLCLFGTIGDVYATIVAKKFPLLKHLEIPDCILSKNALSTMLDGHQNQNQLLTLNTMHCVRLDRQGIQASFFYADQSECQLTDSIRRWCPDAKAMDWNDEEILQKAAGIKSHLQCARKNCSKCRDLYYIINHYHRLYV